MKFVAKCHGDVKHLVCNLPPNQATRLRKSVRKIVRIYSVEFKKKFICVD